MENMELIERHEKTTHYKKDNDLFIEVVTKLGNTCTFKLSKLYPFIIPHVIVNNSLYIDYMKTINPYISILKKLTGHACFCCDSFACCCDNWSQSKRLWEIVDDVDFISKVKLIMLHVYHCNKIAEKYITCDIQLEEYIYPGLYKNI